MNRKLVPLSVALLVALVATVQVATVQAANFELEKNDDGYTVKLDGKMLARYLIKSGAKPIFWPVIGVNGHEVTRAYPMREGNPDEREDHIHHRRHRHFKFDMLTLELSAPFFDPMLSVSKPSRSYFNAILLAILFGHKLVYV